MPDLPIRVDLLKKMHLFRGLNEVQLNSIAVSLQEETVPEDEHLVLKQKTATDFFYIIFDGKVDIFQEINNKEKKLTSLLRGDYFGEQSLLKNRLHNATVRAKKGTVLLKMPRTAFLQTLRSLPELQQNFIIMLRSRNLARKLNFSWVNENEVIYFLSRRHVFMLYKALLGPGMTMLVLLGMLGLSVVFQSMALSGAAGFLIVLTAFWGTWHYLDWTNDYYIVTNQRVINIEKVIAMYDSREEAPMNTIVSVNSESDEFGRIFKYGTVIVRTITGEMRMHYAPRPKHAVAMIEEYLLRTKNVQKQQDEDVMKETIRRKLGLAGPAPAQAAVVVAPAAPPAPKKIGISAALRAYLRGLFYARKESGGTVTYHKHWIALVPNVFLQTLSLIGLISIYPLWYYFNGVFIPLALGSIIAFLMVAVVVWGIYGFMNWSNDIYQVTPDQIIDIYRVPFGDEDRKSAPLENILSTSFERNGLLGQIFNYGIVKIQIGSLNFDFVDVTDPPSVQKDIVQRVNIRQQKKREADAAAERERMAEWLALYHKTMQEIDKQSGQTRNPDSG
ncbi:MAG: cyclic nucleotide-binding domain-containing protein [Anaerolineales bacterium]|jgi:hypothetical protein|nr:cyclic nucleotide-binding domain-containing protein [Anaerolineales bacterium]